MVKQVRLVEGETRIRDKETGKEGTLQSDLALQITVDFDDGTFKWFMKQWYKTEWEIIL